VAEVRLAVGGLAAVPDALVRVDEVKAAVARLVKANAVEDVKFALGAPVAGGGDPRRGQVSLSLLRDVAGITGVRGHRPRLGHVADQAQRRRLRDRVDERGGWVGQQEHVALVDLLEAPDAQSIETNTLTKQVHREVFHWDRKMLPEAR